jgi:hypothetical protein
MVMFEQFNYISNTPILKGTLPNEILEEVSFFVNRCREIKNHPLAELRNHRNVGRNSFQVSIPTNLLMDSFFLAYMIRLGEHYCNITDLKKRAVRINNNQNHYDGYDIWVNFTYKGDVNPIHSHAGDLSGVIYYQNDGLETYFKHAPPYVGKKGDILMFPANFDHGVLEKQTEEERITLSYNLNVLNYER